MKNFTLIALIRIALKNIILLAVVGIVFAAAGLTYCTFFATPKYSATGSVLVTNGAIVSTDLGDKSNLNNADITASMNFVGTVCDILDTNGIYKDLSAVLNTKYNYSFTYGNLKSRFSVSRKDSNSLFINVSCTAETKEEAILIVNEFLEVTPGYIDEYVNGAYIATTNADTASKVSPRTVVITGFSGIVGVAVVYLVLLLIYSLNTVIGSEEDFKERFDIPIIGSVPDFEKARNGYYYKYTYYGNNENIVKGGGVNATKTEEKK
ncbi:MAG: hypothetical protein IKD04_01445 [Clostridia bacterium]|nr:hypothetical protein [Clostridia bacterium]